MSLFRSRKDIEFVKRIAREVTERVVGEKITYYPISNQYSEQDDLYGESKMKIFDPPVEVYCLVEWLEQNITTNQFGQDIVYNLNVYILEEYLNQIELKPTEGDMVDYDEKKFEILKIEQPRQIFAKAGQPLGRKLTCRSVRESQFQTVISGTVEHAARTRPDEPAKIDNLYDDVLFPYSGSND